MKRKLKTVVRLLMTKQQRVLASYSRLNKLSVDSDSSSSSRTKDIQIPKMLDNSKSRQQHSEAVEKFFDEYLQQKHTDADYKFMQAVYSNKDLPVVKNDSLDIDNNKHEICKKQYWFSTKHKLETVKKKSFSRKNIPTQNLIHWTEEQKMISPKSTISISKLFQQSNNPIQNFDEINSRDPI